MLLSEATLLLTAMAFKCSAGQTMALTYGYPPLFPLCEQGKRRPHNHTALKVITRQQFSVLCYEWWITQTPSSRHRNDQKIVLSEHRDKRITKQRRWERERYGDNEKWVYWGIRGGWKDKTFHFPRCCTRGRSQGLQVCMSVKFNGTETYMHKLLTLQWF